MEKGLSKQTKTTTNAVRQRVCLSLSLCCGDQLFTPQMVVTPIVSLLWTRVSVVETVDNTDTTVSVTSYTVHLQPKSEPTTVMSEPRWKGTGVLWVIVLQILYILMSWSRFIEIAGFWTTTTRKPTTVGWRLLTPFETELPLFRYRQNLIITQ